MESIAFVESEKRRRVTHGVSIIGHLHLIVYYIYINRRRKILWKSKATKQNSQRRRKSNRSSLCLLTVTTKTKGKKEREWVREREIKGERAETTQQITMASLTMPRPSQSTSASCSSPIPSRCSFGDQNPTFSFSFRDSRSRVHVCNAAAVVSTP